MKTVGVDQIFGHFQSRDYKHKHSEEKEYAFKEMCLYIDRKNYWWFFA